MQRAMMLSVSLFLTTPLFAAGPANPFVGTIYQAIAAGVVFVVVFMILKKAAWGPILRGLQDREQKIKTDLENAERSAKEATQTLEKYQRQLADAQADAAKLIDQTRAEAAKLSAELKENAHQEITQLKDRAQNDIKTAKEQALNEIYHQASGLVIQVAGRVLQREINADDQEQLVQQSLAELGNATF